MSGGGLLDVEELVAAGAGFVELLLVLLLLLLLEFEGFELPSPPLLALDESESLILIWFYLVVRREGSEGGV